MVRAVNNVDLPTLGRPTMPMEKLILTSLKDLGVFGNQLTKSRDRLE